MAVRSRQAKELDEYAVDLALGAVEDSFSPLDLDAGDIDTAPTSLGLDDREGTEKCSSPRCLAPLTCERR